MQSVGYVELVSEKEKCSTSSGARLFPDQEEYVKWCKNRLRVPKSDTLRAAVRLLRMLFPMGPDHEIEASNIIRTLAGDDAKKAATEVWIAGLGAALRRAMAEKDMPPRRPGSGKAGGGADD